MLLSEWYHGPDAKYGVRKKTFSLVFISLFILKKKKRENNKSIHTLNHCGKLLHRGALAYRLVKRWSLVVVAGMAAAKEEVRWGREEAGSGRLGQTSSCLAVICNDSASISWQNLPVFLSSWEEKLLLCEIQDSFFKKLLNSDDNLPPLSFFYRMNTSARITSFDSTEPQFSIKWTWLSAPSWNYIYVSLSAWIKARQEPESGLCRANPWLLFTCKIDSPACVYRGIKWWGFLFATTDFASWNHHVCLRSLSHTRVVYKRCFFFRDLTWRQKCSSEKSLEHTKAQYLSVINMDQRRPCNPAVIRVGLYIDPCKAFGICGAPIHDLVDWILERSSHIQHWSAPKIGLSDVCDVFSGHKVEYIWSRKAAGLDLILGFCIVVTLNLFLTETAPETQLFFFLIIEDKPASSSFVCKRKRRRRSETESRKLQNAITASAVVNKMTSWIKTKVTFSLIQKKLKHPGIRKTFWVFVTPFVI